MESLPAQEEAGGAGGLSSYEALKRADANWARLRNMPTGTAAGPAPDVVRRKSGKWASAGTASPDTVVYDVVVCGGTLGIFVATTLAMAGKKVAVVERGVLRGRSQEWNISRKELQELVHAGVLSTEEMEAVIAVEFNPNRCGFAGGKDIWVRDILNLGISPRLLLDKVKQKFLEAGGVVLEKVGLTHANVYDDAVILQVDGSEPLVSRLVIDAMGNFSPIVRQIRWGQKPDGMCLVVGGCARGFPPNSTSDVIYTNGPMRRIGASPSQYFWEAFPSGSGPHDRTTYMFAYMDADRDRPSLEAMLEDYWDLMPAYQGVKLDDLQFQRVLFGFFPTYRTSPLPAAFDRVLQVGDASGIQSPLSFGGFGSITRHLSRLTSALCEALEVGALGANQLSLVNPYQPNLSGAWLLQRAMSAQVGSNPSPDFINNLLATNFAAMERLGDPVLRPFLQDVTQFGPLAATMGGMMVSRPDLLPNIFGAVGVGPLLDWMGHFGALGAYTLLSSQAAPRLRSWVDSLPPAERYEWHRRFEAWEFGSGMDYKL
eukprot:TRINITY_DN17188_c0_g1_i1.p1 TRINITY_DN17188_c0_g1~~TRINITY_DN17188_c0_g1_i1.p1  ORF type:complete len:622 (+),score=96.60 TRINITY_DN17188_c0_g1_i1:241-1866(+)